MTGTAAAGFPVIAGASAPCGVAFGSPPQDARRINGAAARANRIQPQPALYVEDVVEEF
jgi:hypothetical protein